MNDNWLEWLLTAMAGIVTATLSWLYKRQDARIAEVERTRVKQEDFDRLADTVHAEVTAFREHTDQRFDAIHKRIDRKFDEQTRQIMDVWKERR